MQEEIKGKCKYVLSLSFSSMDEMIKYMEALNQKKDELGIVRVKWIEERALDKAAHLVERKKKKHREKSILLSNDRAFLSIMEKFSNGENNVITKEG